MNWRSLLGGVISLALWQGPASGADSPSSLQLLLPLDVQLAQQQDPPVVQPPPQPPPPPPPPAPQQAAQAPGTSRFAGRAPNMLGDQSGGGCGGLSFSGLTRVTLEHPTFGCSRLNIAENNSPMPRDRVYFRYNHFHNSTEVDIFSDSPLGRANDLHIDRFTWGLEKTFFEGRASVELRIPFARELSSDILLQDIQGVANLPLRQIDTELGNVSLLFKGLAFRSETFHASAGLGVNFPTGDDVHIRARIDNNNFRLSGRGVNVPRGTTAALQADFGGTVRNETYNLSPFLGVLWTPNERVFASAFFQVDAPLNPSQAEAAGDVVVTAINRVPIGRLRFPLPQASGQLHQQTLSRLDVGIGYWILRRSEARWITGMAPTVEVHWTSTLDDAQLLEQDIQFLNINPSLAVGNLANRVDVVNLTLGNTVEFANRATLATGFGLPLTRGTNKAFDFEFTLQLNWRFGYQDRASRSSF